MKPLIFALCTILVICLLITKISAQDTCKLMLNDYHFSASTATFTDDKTIIIGGSYSDLLISRDTGNSWRRLYGTDRIGAEKIQFTSKSRAFLFSRDFQIYTSDDTAKSWFKVYQDNDYTKHPMLDMSFFSKDTAVFISPKWICRTTNGCFSMDYIEHGYDKLNKVISLDSNTGYIVGNSSTFLKTEDAGNTWRKIEVDSTLMHYTDVFFISKNKGFILRNDGKVIITNGSDSNWIYGGKAEAYYAKKIIFIDSLTGFVLGEDNGYTKIYKTTDGGLTWNIKKYAVNSSASDIAFSQNGKNGIVVVRESWDNSHAILTTSDSGNTWLYKSFYYNFDDHDDIQFLEDQTMYLSSGRNYNGKVFKSMDSGLSWRELQFYPGYRILDLEFINKDVGFVATNKLYKTLDGGVNWTVSYPEKVDKVIFVSNSTGYLLSRKDIYITNDTGLTWSISYNGTYEQFYNIVSMSESELIAVGSHAAVLTKNGGASWSNIDDIDDMLILAIEAIDANTVIIGDIYSDKLYISINKGIDWNEISETFQFSIKDIAFFDELNGILISGHDSYSGLFLSKDVGKSWDYWTRVNKGLNSIEIVDKRSAFLVGDDGEILHIQPQKEAPLPTFIKGDTIALANKVHKYCLYVYESDSVYWYSQGSNFLKVENDTCYVSWPNSGNYKVSASIVNSCGSGPAREFDVVVLKNSNIDQEVLDIKLQIFLFPNPCNNYFYINFAQPETNNCRMEILNLDGRIERTLFLKNLDDSKTIKINTDKLPCGLYIIRLSTNEHQIHYKIMKIEK